MAKINSYYKDFTIEGDFFKWSVNKEGNLVMEMNSSYDKEEFQELQDSDFNNSDSLEFMVESELGNGMAWHHDLGESGFGLTEACGVTLGSYDVELYVDFELFYHNDYMLISVLDKIKRDGFVIFHRVAD